MFEELKKYFEFSGTTSGTQYFLRNLVSSIAAFTVGGVIGVGTVLNTIIVIVLGVLLLIPVLWFAIANTYKRINAFYPNQAVALTTGLSLLQLVSPFGKGETWGVLLNLTFLITGILLIFCNSKVEIHKG